MCFAQDAIGTLRIVLRQFLLGRVIHIVVLAVRDLDRLDIQMNSGNLDIPDPKFLANPLNHPSSPIVLNGCVHANARQGFQLTELKVRAALGTRGNYLPQTVWPRLR